MRSFVLIIPATGVNAENLTLNSIGSQSGLLTPRAGGFRLAVLPREPFRRFLFTEDDLGFLTPTVKPDTIIFDGAITGCLRQVHQAIKRRFRVTAATAPISDR
jgi:hypothetical protein